MPKVPKSLQDEWDKKLADSGFEDIEKRFQFHSTQFYRKAEREKMLKEKQSYYANAWDFLEFYDFSSVLEKQVWHLHAVGEVTRAIAKTLKISKSKTDRIIQRHKQIMLKAY